MKKVAKLVMVDSDDKYLLMHRSEHRLNPAFSFDPDLPGGTLEAGETTLETMLREVEEEIGVSVNADNAKEVYAGTDYSAHSTHYALYVAKVAEQPEITMSWEHSSYEWLLKAEFVAKAKGAKDTFMHMVGEVIEAEK